MAAPNLPYHETANVAEKVLRRAEIAKVRYRNQTRKRDNEVVKC